MQSKSNKTLSVSTPILLGQTEPDSLVFLFIQKQSYATHAEQMLRSKFLLQRTSKIRSWLYNSSIQEMIPYYKKNHIFHQLTAGHTHFEVPGQ